MNKETGQVRVYPSEVAKAEISMLAKNRDLDPRDVALLTLIYVKPGPFRKGQIHCKYHLNKMLFYQRVYMGRRYLGEAFPHDEFRSAPSGGARAYVIEMEEKSLTINKIDYENAFTMASECEVFFNRANLLFYCKDYSGSLEATQHLVEWALKALFVLVSEYNKEMWNHDPMIYLPRLERKLKPVFDALKNQNFREKQFERLKDISKRVSEYHNKAFYGSYWEDVEPGKHISASEMITLKDVDQFLPEGAFVKEFLTNTILIFGYASGLNSNERNKELGERLLYGLTPKHYDELKEIIKSSE
ncbi:MAG: HEPN domain-containing protein [Candidatus Bathyarchaeota archaeon]|nr:HEPN domain-containing protein [Candidatus Bathyarchaeota archaeon]